MSLSSRQFHFSEVLQACLKHGTDVVVNHLQQVQELKKQQEIDKNRKQEAVQNENNEQLENMNIDNIDNIDSDDSSSNEHHSDDEKYSQISIDNELESNKKVIDISLDVQSLIKDKRINCNYPSSKFKNTNNNNNKRNKKITFSEHLKLHQQAQRIRYLPSTFQSSILYHIEWQRKLVGHRIGLIIMATAMGKTILAILDIEKELNDIHTTLGTEYGINCEINSNNGIFIDKFFCCCLFYSSYSIK